MHWWVKILPTYYLVTKCWDFTKLTWGSLVSLCLTFFSPYSLVKSKDGLDRRFNARHQLHGWLNGCLGKNKWKCKLLLLYYILRLFKDDIKLVIRVKVKERKKRGKSMLFFLTQCKLQTNSIQSCVLQLGVCFSSLGESVKLHGPAPPTLLRHSRGEPLPQLPKRKKNMTTIFRMILRAKQWERVFTLLLYL